MSMCLNIPVDWEIAAQIFTVIGAIGTILAIVFSAYALNKTLYASERPYIVCYPVYDEQHNTIVLVVKNFGNSSAKIKSLKITPELMIHKKSCNDILSDVLLAPNQQMHFITDLINKDRILKEKAYIYEIELEYLDVNKPQKSIKETNSISLKYATDVLSTRSRISNYTNAENCLYNIEKALNTISMKNL